mmetsp:Transcript_38348/g.119196  ORF Transcript_38348/g.119196 Transcript_38348/m.119196 type:complete len:267 (+) Transcript_38348:58-858(+)
MSHAHAPQEGRTAATAWISALHASRQSRRAPSLWRTGAGASHRAPVQPPAAGAARAGAALPSRQLVPGCPPREHKGIRPATDRVVEPRLVVPVPRRVSLAGAGAGGRGARAGQHVERPGRGLRLGAAACVVGPCESPIQGTLHRGAVGIPTGEAARRVVRQAKRQPSSSRDVLHRGGDDVVDPGRGRGLAVRHSAGVVEALLLQHHAPLRSVPGRVGGQAGDVALVHPGAGDAAGAEDGHLAALGPPRAGGREGGKGRSGQGLGSS